MSNNAQNTVQEKKEISINSTRNETLPNGVTVHTLVLLYTALKKEMSKPAEEKKPSQIHTLCEQITTCVRPLSKQLSASVPESVIKITEEFLGVFQIEEIDYQTD